MSSSKNHKKGGVKKEDNIKLLPLERNLVAQKLHRINVLRAEVRELEQTVQDFVAIAINRAGKNPVDYALDTNKIEIIERPQKPRLELPTKEGN